MEKTHYSYCVFYLETESYKNINQDLKDNGYTDIEAIIPTIKYLDHYSSRGKNVEIEVPILFNYGFLKIPTYLVYDRSYMKHLKSSIPGIRGWLIDTVSLHRKRGRRLRVDNVDIFDDFSKIALVSESDINRFLEISKENSILSFDDITKIRVGDYIVLKNYPYIGVDSVIEDIDMDHSRIKLLLYPQSYKLHHWVPMDLVIYSVYKDYDPFKLLSDQLKRNPETLIIE